MRIQEVRAISDALVLICEVNGGERIGVPRHLIDPTSEVHAPGDCGVLVIPQTLPRDLGVTAVTSEDNTPAPHAADGGCTTVDAGRIDRTGTTR